MSELVLCYSFTGNTKRLAEEYARENGLALCEVRTQKPLGKFAAYTAGCLKALKGAGMPIEAPAEDLSDCEAAQVFAPVWAGHIAPPMNSALALLPKGAKLCLHMVSGGGSSNQDGITERLRNIGLEVTAYEDIRQ
jgi:flavodoxin